MKGDILGATMDTSKTKTKARLLHNADVRTAIGI